MVKICLETVEKNFGSFMKLNCLTKIYADDAYLSTVVGCCELIRCYIHQYLTQVVKRLFPSSSVSC